MIRIKDIQTALLHLVGWEQSYNPEEAIAEALTTSESGLTFQAAHPLLTLDNVRSVLPDDYGFKYPTWDEATTYGVGIKVRYDGSVWLCMAENVNTKPSDGLSEWKRYNLLSDYLEAATSGAIATMVQRFITSKQLSAETKTLMERRTLFDGAGRLSATLQNRGKLVGIELVPVRSMGVTTKIERVGLQMVGGVGKVRLYLFHSSQVEPTAYTDLDYTKTNGGVQWFTLSDWYMPYISDANNAGGSWYIVYNQNDLPSGMEAINVSKDWSREPCGSCNVGSLEAWREITKYLQISPFQLHAPTTFAEYPEMWDVADIAYTNTTNYGLNLEVSVMCDLTDFIIEQRAMFATALQLQVATNLLRTIAMNPNARVNRNQANVSKSDVIYELDGNVNTMQRGLGTDLEAAYKALSISTRGIDRICLACNNHGVRYRTT